MRPYIIALATVLWLAINASAQDAAAPVTVITATGPATVIENFELQTNTIIVRGFSLIGTLSIGNDAISIHAKEDNDVSHGQKAYGITVQLKDGRQAPGTSYSLAIDYDELDSLLNAIDYVSKVTWGVTQLNGFEAAFTTKSGFSVIAHSDRRAGAIATYIQFGTAARIAMDSDQMTQLRNLIVQAKATLDGLK